MHEPSTSLATKIETRIDKSVTKNTGLTKSGGMHFQSVEQIMEFSKVMSIAGVAIPKHLRENPGACLAVAIQASEWQMSPFAVANKSYVVNDRIGYEAQLVNAVILMRAPIKGRFKITYSGSGATRRCKVAAVLADGETVEYESPAFSEITTKNSPLWKADPDQQLFYYSSRAMCRRHFPDVILGVYTADELADGAIEMTATVREMPRMPEAKPRQIEEVKPQPQPVKQEESFTLSGEGPTDRERLSAMIQEAGFDTATAMHALKKMKLADAGCVALTHVADEVIADSLADFTTLMLAMKEVSK